MKTNKDKHYFKKKGKDSLKNKSRNYSLLNLRLIHKIFNTINLSSLVLIFILYFLSSSSQRKWTSIYKSLSTTKASNNNLIDYISQTEEFHINELESLKTLKKTTPRDLMYLERVVEKKENYFKKKIANIIYGIKNSKYQIGY